MIFNAPVKLRAIELSDVEHIYAWSNDFELQRGLYGWHFPLSQRHIEEWVNGFPHDSLNQRLLVEVDDQPIGLAQLTDIDLKNRCSQIGLVIDREHQGRGLGKKVIDALLGFAFNELNLNRVETTILESNIASLKLFVDKCGFKKEGIKRKSVFRGGDFQNNVVVALLKSEFTASNL